MNRLSVSYKDKHPGTGEDYKFLRKRIKRSKLMNDW